MKTQSTGPFTIAVLAILGLTTPGWCQGAGAIPGATLVRGGAEDPGSLLGNVFKDEVNGFRLTPPVAARVSTRAGLDLMTFVVDQRGWGGSLQKVLLEKVTTLDEYTKTVIEALSTQRTIKDSQGREVQVRAFKGVQVINKAAAKVGNFNAMKLALSMQADITQVDGKPGTLQLYRQQLIVQTQENLFFVFTCYSPLDDRVNAARTFDAVAGTLELFDPREMREKRAKAIVDGQKWLTRLTAEEHKAKALNAPQFFRIIVGGANGTDTGYVAFDEAETIRDGMKGMEVHVLSRTFPETGPVSGQNVAFWAFSKGDKGEPLAHYSVWDNISEKTAKVQSARDPKVLIDKTFWNEESGIISMEANPRYTDEDIKKLEDDREAQIRLHPDRPPPPLIEVAAKQYHLIVKLDGDDTQGRPNLKPIGQVQGFQSGAGGAAAVANNAVDVKVPPHAAHPLFKALDYSWPRFVDVKVPSEMSFVVFNPSMQKLTLRNLVVTGRKETITVSGQQMECWRLIDELDPGSTTLWVDSNGIIKCMRTSDQTVLAPTTEAEMRTKWATRLAGQLQPRPGNP